jgi:hypothetical protein
MARQARLDVPLSSEQRRELDTLAAQAGLTPTALGPLGIVWVLAHGDILLKGPSPAVPSNDVAAGGLSHDRQA